jgi:pyrroloquinoline quinone (PQQ) biosynthesis protein C
VTEAMQRRVEAAVVEEWFRDPPALIAAMGSAPTIAVTRAFVLQWTKFSRLFPRWVGAVISNCPEWEVVAYEVENLFSEVVRDPAAGANHYELLIRLGEGVGLSRSAIEAHAVLPEAASAFAWLGEKARHPNWLVGFAAVNGLEILGDRNLPRRYGITTGTGLAPEPYAQGLGLGETSLEFFEVSDEADAAHGHQTVDIIARYTPPDQADDILAVLTEAMARLRAMMDSVWELAMEIEAGLHDEGRSDE